MFSENPANEPWDDVTYHYNPLWVSKITGEFQGKFGVSPVLERHPYQSLKACPHQHVRLGCPIPESKFSRIMCELIVQEPPINPRIVQKDFPTSVTQTRKLKGNEKGFMTLWGVGLKQWSGWPERASWHMCIVTSSEQWSARKTLLVRVVILEIF